MKQANSNFRLALLVSLLGILTSNYTFAQQGFSYQAVARNASGVPLADQDLTVRLAILAESLDGEVVWQEEHPVRTSSLGLFSLTVGDPAALNQSGSAPTFGQIDWSAHNYFLKVWVNTTGSFIEMGGSPIQTVPMAQYAATASSATSNFSIQPANEASPGEALFEVKRRDGQPVFAVYEDMVWVYVDTVVSKGVKGGFAVGGYSRNKGVTQEYMRVSSDSVRIYIDSDPQSKGVKGGFAVGGYSRNKGIAGDLFLNLSPRNDAEVIRDKSQILFYPSKDAFFAGTIHVGSPDSVGFNSTALGYESVAMGRYSQGFGFKSMALGDYSTAIGREAVAMQNSFALGNTSKALGNDSYAFGSGAMASGNKSFAFGSVGIDTAGLPTGVPTSASGDYSIAFGMGARALNSGALSMGPSSTAEGWQSVAIGSGSTASGSYSTAVGYRTRAEGYKSIAIGAHYSYSLYIPNYPKTKGTGGFELPDIKIPKYNFLPRTVTAYNEAEGDYSISLGNGNYSLDGGFALGTYNKAYSQGSVAFGVSNIAQRAYSLAAGYNNEVTGYYSVAIGDNVTSQAMNNIAVGKYNEITGDTADWIDTDPIFQVGNGTSSSDRHDAFRVNKDGRTYINPVDASYGLNISSTNNSYNGYFYSLINSDNNRATIYGVRSIISSSDPDLSAAYSGRFTGFVSSGTYHGLYADIRSGGAIDVAEYIYDTNGDTEASDVLVADPSNAESVIRSSRPYQSSVLGVVSTKPHMVIGMELVVDEQTGEPIPGVSATRLALTGRVPVKVTEENGPIQPGDLLTSSSTPGHAMKWSLLDVSTAADFEELKSMLAENERRRNAVIGKAVGSSSGTGTVMVLISLQ